MGYNEDLVKIKQRIDSAFKEGLVSQDKDFIESSLIQILNDAERNRQNCMTAAENFKRQAAVMEGQAAGFASFSSIIVGVLNGFVLQAERAREEAMQREAEQKEIEEEKPVTVETLSKKRRGK